jgi:hypothetical protein
MTRWTTLERRLQRLEQHRAIKDAPPYEAWIVSEGIATNQKTGEEITVDELEERNPPRITWILIPEIPMHDDPDWFALAWAGKMQPGEFTLDGIARALGYESTDAMEDDILNGHGLNDTKRVSRMPSGVWRLLVGTGTNSLMPCPPTCVRPTGL